MPKIKNNQSSRQGNTKPLDALSEAIESINHRAANLASTWDDINRNATEAQSRYNKGWTGFALKMLGVEKKVTSVEAALSAAAKLEFIDQDSLKKSLAMMETQVKQYEKAASAYKDKQGNMRLDTDQARRFQAAQSLLKVDQTRLDLAGLLNTKTTKIARVALPAMLAASWKVVAMAGTLNDLYIQAESSWEHRIQLMNTTLRVQTQLGLSYSETGAAVKALVDYGYENHKNLEATARTVAMMNKGLGISEDTSAQLAVIYSKWDVSLDSVANRLAGVTDQTALASQKAAEYALNIGKAMHALNVNLVRGPNSVVDMINRLEGAMQKVAGTSGGIQQMMTRMTTTEGLVTTGLLGTRPDFLSSEAETRKVVDRIGGYIESVLGQSAGWDRMMRLDLLEQSLGMSRHEIVNFSAAVDEYRRSTTSAVDIQTRWENQTKSLSESVREIRKSFLGLMQQGFLPILKWVSTVVDWVARAIQWIGKFKATSVVAFTLVTAGSIGAIIQLTKLGHAILVLARQSAIARQMMYSAALGGVPGRAGSRIPVPPPLPGAGVGARAGFQMQRLFRFLASPKFAIGVLGVGVAAGVGVALGRVIDKMADKWQWMEYLIWLKPMARHLGKTTAQSTFAETVVGPAGPKISDLENAIMDMVASNRSHADIIQFFQERVGHLGGIMSAQEHRVPQLVEAMAQRISDKMAMASYNELVSGGFVNRSDEANRKYDELIGLMKRFADDQELSRVAVQEALKVHVKGAGERKMYEEETKRQQALQEAKKRHEEASDDRIRMLGTQY